MANVLTNGTLEAWTANVPDGWTSTAAGTSTLAQENTIIHGGTSSAKCVVSVADDATGILQTPPFVTGRFYQPSLWFNATAGKANTLRVQFDGGALWLQNDGTWSASVNQFTLTGTGAWAQLVGPVSVAVPAGRTTLTFEVARGDASQTFYLDDLILNETAPAASGGSMLLTGVGQ